MILHLISTDFQFTKLHPLLHTDKRYHFGRIKFVENLNESEFFKLLVKNDQNELENFLISEGKGPKPICPIYFQPVKKDNGNEEKET